MNELEKKSFYSFLSLYLLSSFLFVLFSGYWYYSAQKNSLESTTYYKLSHIADKLSGLIINAQMEGKVLHLPNEIGFKYMLIPLTDTGRYKLGYYEENGYKVLGSDSPQKHMSIKYVIVKTKRYFQQLKELKKTVLIVMGISFLLIVLISLFSPNSL